MLSLCCPCHAGRIVALTASSDLLVVHLLITGFSTRSLTHSLTYSQTHPHTHTLTHSHVGHLVDTYPKRLTISRFVERDSTLSLRYIKMTIEQVSSVHS